MLFQVRFLATKQASLPGKVSRASTRCLSLTSRCAGSTDVWYRHCEKATTTPVKGELSGQIPSWLKGTLIRNGPGVLQVGEHKYQHLFDGMAVLHRYHVENGQAYYSSRPLESDTYKRNMKAQRIVVSEFGTAAFPDPCESIFSRLKSKFSAVLGGGDSMTDNCSVNVGYYGDQLYAMTETCFVRRISPDDLKTIGEKTRITDFVACNHATAHPHVLEDGTIVNVGNNYTHKNGPHYCFIAVPPAFESSETCFKNTRMIGQVPFSSKMYPSYFHSFGITKNHIVFIEAPLQLDLKALIKANLVGQSYNECMRWQGDGKTRIHVLDLKTGAVHPVKYEADPFFTFHHINAFEENGQIVVDVAGYDHGGIVFELADQVARQQKLKNSKATARRFVLPLNVPQGAAEDQNLVTLKGSRAKAFVTKQASDDGKGSKPTVRCSTEDLSDCYVELPRINYKYNGQAYKYYYAVGTADKKFSQDVSCIIKGDVTTGKTTTWTEDGLSPGEPVFVPNPTAKSGDEDDGVLLVPLMNDAVLDQAQLMILNAKNLQELARAKFKLESAFTVTFHGEWATAGERLHMY